MNKLIMTGFVTKKPDYTEGNNGKASRATFSIGISRGKDSQGKDRTDFPYFTCFGKTADLAGKWLDKGRHILVEGRVATGSYEKDGKTFYTTDLIADRIEFLGKKESSGETASAEPDPGPVPEGFSTLSSEDPEW